MKPGKRPGRLDNFQSKENVKIEIEDNQLFVSGTREEKTAGKKDDGQRSLQLSERLYGSFSRAFGMPTTVDTGKIEAKYENGVLQIAVPKAESAKPRQVKIV
ncbi:MAG: Hsp20/alpha crystallin family protein [Deltaproteobacteria bacterium]|nr:Hsp20/alpha crystallin family protein [Deltaproteobacteria bacterium]